MFDCHLAKVKVVGSSPISRSILFIGISMLYAVSILMGVAIKKDKNGRILDAL